MKPERLSWQLIAVFAVLIACVRSPLSAGEPFNLIGWITGTDINVKPYSCDTCGKNHGAEGSCISRQPVEDCVVGKKEVFISKIRYEYVSIPETRYHWKKMKVTKEIPCSYCKPVCRTGECQQCVGVEKWEKHCDDCGQSHCKHIEHKLEKVPTKQCEHEKGETVIKAKYWSCVKVPYTVYRRVKRPVCVKQPRYEKVSVPITRYVCSRCNGGGCGQCDGE